MILGLSCDYHDAAAAVLIGGRVVAAAEEERFSRVKHDASLPRRAVEECLRIADRSAAEVDHVVFHEKPLVATARYLASRRRMGPAGLPSFVRDSRQLVGRNLMIGARIGRLFRDLGAADPPVVEFAEHHRSHAAAAFYPSPFEHAAVLTVDGLGEWATATVGHGAARRLTLLEEQRYPDSIGLVYSFFTWYCGFEPNDGESKLMGLAPYGSPTFSDAIAKVVTVHDDGSVTVAPEGFGWFLGGRNDRRMHRRFGGPPARQGDDPGDREADLAASVQALLETVMLRKAVHAHRLTGERRLCLAGGVALNSVANGRIAREGPFDDVWIQPAAGDAGSALGAALWYWHEVLQGPRPAPRRDAMSGSRLGPATHDEDVVAALDAAGITAIRCADAELAPTVARRLAAGDIVGWFDGPLEFGPRALGGRSILADPRDPLVRTRLNAKIKGRESFRPFGPMVLEEHAADWFELDGPSPYMLIVAPVLARHLVDVGTEPAGIVERSAVPRSTIPACTHVDGSARIQTLGPGDDPRLRSVLEAFHVLTGVPMVINTSFNRAGEPIVASVHDALATAAEAGLDLLVVGGCLVEGAVFGESHRRRGDGP